MSIKAAAAERPDFSLSRRLVVGAGLLLSVLLALRSRVLGEQIELLARGWWLVREGVLIPFGMPASSGGASPGSVTSLLTGLPLFAWMDYRAVTLFTTGLHLVAYLMVDRLLQRSVSGRGRLVFAVIFWLNPTRLYLSAVVWNPGYLILFSALHLWSSLMLARRRSFGITVVHVLVITLAMQVHLSGLLLAGGSAVLFLMKRLRLSPMGVAAGAGLSGLSLVPWARAVLARPDLLPLDPASGSSGIPLLHPFLRGVSLWIRAGSFHASSKVMEPVPDAVPTGISILLVATLVLPLVAYFWFLRRNLRRRLRGPLARSGDGDLLHSYGLALFLGALPIFALSPTAIMWWQTFVVLPGAVMPVVLWSDLALRSRRGRLVRVVVGGVALAGILGGLQLYTQGYMFRCGERFTVRAGSRILTDLGVGHTCPVRVDPEEGWWNPILDSPEGVVARKP